MHYRAGRERAVWFAGWILLALGVVVAVGVSALVAYKAVGSPHGVPPVKACAVVLAGFLCAAAAWLVAWWAFTGTGTDG